MNQDERDREATYQMQLRVEPHWLVGYHPERDELFLYRIDCDGIISVFRKGGLDVMGFYEFFDFSKAELLGEL